MDLSLQQLGLIVGIVLIFAACGWAWDVMRRAGVSPWTAIARYVAVQIMSNEIREIDEIDDESQATTSTQNNNNTVAITQNDSNALLFQLKAEVLATMVKAGKIGETEGIKLVFGVAPSSSNPRYLAARAALKEELMKLDPPKYHLTPEQIKMREELGLSLSTDTSPLAKHTRA